MAKAILLLFGWLSIVAGLLVVAFSLLTGRAAPFFIGASAGLLLAGAPLVALASILTLLERIARAAEATAAHGSERKSQRLAERAAQSMAAPRLQSEVPETSPRLEDPSGRFFEEAERDGMESGTASGRPWRRRPDGSIDAIVDGQLKRFASYAEFMKE
jgi:hypothetical protein